MSATLNGNELIISKIKTILHSKLLKFKVRKLSKEPAVYWSRRAGGENSSNLKPLNFLKTALPIYHLNKSVSTDLSPPCNDILPCHQDVHHFGDKYYPILNRVLDYEQVI